MRYTVKTCTSIHNPLNIEEIQFLRDSFIRLDVDGDGVLSLNELLDIFGEDIPEIKLKTNEKLNLTSYIKFFAKNLDVVRKRVTPAYVKLSDDEILLLEEAFNNMDTNNDGYIDEGELYDAITESFQSCIDETSLIWLTGIIMKQVDRDDDRRISISEFIITLQENQGVFPPEIIVSSLKKEKKWMHANNNKSKKLEIQLKQFLSPYEVFILLSVINKIAYRKFTLSGVEFRICLLQELKELREPPLVFITMKLVSHICFRALLLAPNEEVIGAIDCKRFSSVITSNPSILHFNVPSCLHRLELSIRFLENISYDIGRRLTMTLMKLDLNSDGVEQLHKLFQTLRMTFPEMKDEFLCGLTRCCTTAAEVTTDGSFSLQKLVRRLSIKYYVLPCGYAGGKLWRRLSPLEKSQIQYYLLYSDLNKWYVMSREELREFVSKCLLESDFFWDQEYVASFIASWVESIIFSHKIPLNDLHQFISQENWSLSNDLVEESCRTEIAAKMTEINLGREGLFAVLKTICHLDTSLNGIIEEKLLFSSLKIAIKKLKPHWNIMQIDRALSDIILSCELTNQDQYVNCRGFLERLLQNSYS